MGVSENGGTPKSSILIGFSIRNSIHFGVSLFLDFHPSLGSIFFPQPTGFPLPSRFIAGPQKPEDWTSVEVWLFEPENMWVPTSTSRILGVPPAKMDLQTCKMVTNGVAWGPYKWPYTWVSLCFFLISISGVLSDPTYDWAHFLGSQRNDLLIFFS